MKYANKYEACNSYSKSISVFAIAFKLFIYSWPLGLFMGHFL